jgi:hypothetical protein
VADTRVAFEPDLIVTLTIGAVAETVIVGPRPALSPCFSPGTAVPAHV